MIVLSENKSGMRLISVICGGLLLCSLFTGCHQPVDPAVVAEYKEQKKIEEQSNPPLKDSEGVKLHQDEPLTNLPRLKLYLGDKVLNAELALGVKEFATGMMHRKEIPDDAAMLFVYALPAQAAFYMKNTYVPLSCAYIDPEGVILEIYDMTPLDENPILSKSNDIRYVLEVKQGWFEKNGITPGTLICTERGSLLEVFPRY